MTDPNASKTTALRRLIWPLRLTRLGMVAEDFARAFWPVWSLVFAALTAFAFGAVQLFTPTTLWIGLAVLACALLWLLFRGLKTFHLPTAGEALDRLDQTLPGRPITALIDAPALGSDDPGTQELWQVHLQRMAARIADARALEPDLRLADRDPFGLRLMAVTGLIMALLFGTVWRVAEVGEAIAGAPNLVLEAGPSWEGWVEPPIYTSLPSLYLNDIVDEEFSAPAGSRITLRFYGEPGQILVDQTVQPLISPPDEGRQSHQFVVEQSGSLAVVGPGERSWTITMLEDAGPTVRLVEPVSSVLPGSFQMMYGAEDDYGIAGGIAVISLAADLADRRYGLALPPEPRADEVLTLPLPFTGNRAEFSEVLIEDFSQHPFANLPVRLTLSVEDDAGQTGENVIELDRLPGRRFFDPMANALIEMRRDLLWNRANATRVAQLLRAISHEPDTAFSSEDHYRLVRGVIQRIDARVDAMTPEYRDELADILWEVAILIEEGDLSDVLERLRRAQDRLAEAMRQGASDEEIAELMRELREAMDDYMQDLAENMEPGDGTDQPDQSGESMELSQNDIDEMMRRIEELMQQGRMAEAMEMLEALRQMMENLQMTEGGNDPNGPQSPGQQAMEGLQDTLRDQQGLADESFRELQQGRPGQPQPGQEPGEGEEGSLAERQAELFEQLRDQAQSLPGRGTEDGDEALQRLEEAGRAMRDAIEELENGDMAQALDSQAEAMEALREGMQSLGEALAEENGDQPGQGQAEGSMEARDQLRDPLGRQSGNGGALATDEAFEEREEAFRRARDLMDEIRRRSSEQTRPEFELDYLRRLLDRFAMSDR